MTNLDVQLPAGIQFADVDQWEPAEDDHPAYRMFWSRPLHPKVWIRVCGVQYTDGSIATDGADAPVVYIDNDDFTPSAARELAAAIVHAADLADAWVGVPR